MIIPSIWENKSHVPNHQPENMWETFKFGRVAPSSDKAHNEFLRSWLCLHFETKLQIVVLLSRNPRHFDISDVFPSSKLHFLGHGNSPWKRQSGNVLSIQRLEPLDWWMIFTMPRSDHTISTVKRRAILPHPQQLPCARGPQLIGRVQSWYPPFLKKDVRPYFSPLAYYSLRGTAGK